MLQRPSEKILALPRPAKRGVALVIDALICLTTVAVAYWLRLGDWTPPTGYQIWSYAAPVIIAIPLFILFGLYRAIFAVIGVPRTIGIIQPILGSVSIQ